MRCHGESIVATVALNTALCFEVSVQSYDARNWLVSGARSERGEGAGGGT